MQVCFLSGCIAAAGDIWWYLVIRGFGGEPKDLSCAEWQDFPLGLPWIWISIADVLTEWHTLLEPVAPCLHISHNGSKGFNAFDKRVFGQSFILVQLDDRPGYWISDNLDWAVSEPLKALVRLAVWLLSVGPCCTVTTPLAQDWLARWALMKVGNGQCYAEMHSWKEIWMNPV